MFLKMNRRLTGFGGNLLELALLLSLDGVGVGIGIKADCLKKGPRPISGMPSVVVFLRDPSPYLREFR